MGTIVMKRIAYLFFMLSALLLSCKDEDKEKTDINQLVAEKLQSAVQAQKTVSLTKYVESIKDESAIWQIVFSDDTILELLAEFVRSVIYSDVAKEYTITLSDNNQFVFKEETVEEEVPIVYPTEIIPLTPSVSLMRNTEFCIEFRVNPSHATFNYDVMSADCQIALDVAGTLPTYSYVTEPERFRLTRIEKVKEGQYKAFLRDNNGANPYKYAVAFVLTMNDAKTETTYQISSATVPVERKKATNLPVVVIHTENNAEIVDQENWIAAAMTIDGLGSFADYEGTISIRGRGNTTWRYPKKPYAIKLDEKESILGMPKHKRWVLLANYMDRTLMRNHITFKLAQVTGLEWTPRGQFVEVVLNAILCKCLHNSAYVKSNIM